MHIRAGIRIGLTPEEITEVIMHTAPYTGVPSANAAIAVAKHVLNATDDQPIAADSRSSAHARLKFPASRHRGRLGTSW